MPSTTDDYHSGAVEFKNLGEPVQKLLRSLKRDATEREMLMFSKITVIEMAGIFDRLAKEEDPEKILAWLEERHQRKAPKENAAQREVRLLLEAEEKDRIEQQDARRSERNAIGAEEEEAREIIASMEQRKWDEIMEDLRRCLDREGAHFHAVVDIFFKERDAREEIALSEQLAWDELLNQWKTLDESVEFAKDHVANFGMWWNESTIYWRRIVRSMKKSDTVALVIAPETTPLTFTRKEALLRLLDSEVSRYGWERWDCGDFWYMLAADHMNRDGSSKVKVGGYELTFIECLVQAAEHLQRLLKERNEGGQLEEMLISEIIVLIARSLPDKKTEIAICSYPQTKVGLLIIAINWWWNNESAWGALTELLEDNETVKLAGMEFTALDVATHAMDAFPEAYTKSPLMWKRLADRNFSDVSTPMVQVGDELLTALECLKKAAALSKRYYIDLALRVAVGSKVQIRPGEDKVPQKQVMAEGLAAVHNFGIEMDAATLEEAYAMMAVFLGPDEEYEEGGVTFTTELCIARAGPTFTRFWLSNDFHQAQRNFFERMEAIEKMRIIREKVRSAEADEAEPYAEHIRQLNEMATEDVTKRVQFSFEARNGALAIRKEEQEAWDEILAAYRVIASDYNRRVQEQFRASYESLLAVEKAMRQAREGALAAERVFWTQMAAERRKILVEFSKTRQPIVQDIRGTMDTYNAKIAETFKPDFEKLFEEQARARTRITNNTKEPLLIIREKERESHSEILVWLLRMGNMREDSDGNKFTLLTKSGRIKVPEGPKLAAIKPPIVRYMLQNHSDRWVPVFDRKNRIVVFEFADTKQRFASITEALGLPETLILDQGDGNVPKILQSQGVYQAAKDDSGCEYFWNETNKKTTYDLAKDWIVPPVPQVEEDPEETVTSPKVASKLKEFASARKEKDMYLEIADPAGGPSTFRNLRTREVRDSAPSGAVVYAPQDADDGTYFYNTQTMSTYWDLPDVATSASQAFTDPNEGIDAAAAAYSAEEEERRYLAELEAEELFLAEATKAEMEAKRTLMFVQYSDPETNEPYYMNVRSGNTVWEIPAGATVYVRAETEENGDEYFYNADTQSTHWSLDE